ncbi:unnamed protein product [Rotaria sordida]|uniref:Rab-GAP TBC domain-containing protein n=1 Tax=Rotaria sordida TaxID=392033 RepID=A0A815AIH0_9BILA|nr:unnamed protein product [Rotaria sordida]CAF1258213.1 unnamed protein product [Rotaria sordida]CAF3590883.1 unnamed protein product [Rotaria sordida]CAF3604268.1 unnamed protein product [Rotaria sordida]
MVTINNDDNYENENILVIDKIKLLFDRYNQKKIKQKYLKRKLTSYAKISGFINNIYRKQAWNLLVHTSSDEYTTDINQIESHQYYEQIKLDVIRTLKRFPPNYSDSERSELQDELILIITKILIKHEELHYYQGYHDISLTFLLVLGEDLCLPVIDSITMSHLKYFMEPTMEKTRDSLLYLMPLINCINSECAEYMERGDVGHVIFALPWFITWYSHVLDDLPVILRLYDLFIVSHFLMPIYVAAEIVNYHADEILSKPCEMASLHQYLSYLPTEIDENTWEEIIRRALYLFENHHPDTLENLNHEWKIKCEYIENSSNKSIIRQRFDKNNNYNKQNLSQKSSTLSRIAFWGVTLTIGGLAIYLWNQTQLLDSTKFINLGDFLTQLYRTQ